MLRADRPIVTTAAPSILTVEGVTKRFGARPVLNGVSFDLFPGTVTCLAGGNGAGKSTLLRCLVGLTKFEGSAQLGDVRLPDGEGVRENIGYLPQAPSLLDTATVAETIGFFADLRGASPEIPELPQGFLPPAEARIGTLSGGQRQRVAFAIALLGRPSVLILDEPVANLDPQAREAVWHILRRLAAAGITVLLASPAPDDLGRVADRVIRLADGVIVEDTGTHSEGARPHAPDTPLPAPGDRPRSTRGRFGPVGALARWELRTAARTRWVIATGAVFAAAVAAVLLLGLRGLAEFGLVGVGPASAGLHALGLMLVPLLGLLLGAAAVAGARERGLLPMIAAQPLRRGHIAAGVFLGATGAVCAAVGVGFGAGAVLLGAVVRVDDLVPLAALAGATLLLACASVAVGVAISAFSATRMQATAFATMAWFLFVFGVDLLFVGVIPAVSFGAPLLLAGGVLNPVEAARLLALLATDTGGASLGPFGVYLDDALGVSNTLFLLGSALVAWTVLPVALAGRALRSRDL